MATSLQYQSQDLPVISVPPDWAVTRPQQIIQYRTLVREALALNEQRFMQRPRPLYGIKYSARIRGPQETSYIRKVIERAQALPVACPMWTDRERLVMHGEIGDTELVVSNTVGRLFAVFPYALLWLDFQTWKVVSVDVIDDITLALDEPLEERWPAGNSGFDGTSIMPLMIGNLKRPSHRLITDEAAEKPIDFIETFHSLYNQSFRELATPRCAGFRITTDSFLGEYMQGSDDVDVTLAVTGGTGPFIWTLIDGELPDGVTLADGVLSGTPTADPGNYYFTLHVEDSATPLSCGRTKQFRIEVL